MFAGFDHRDPYFVNGNEDLVINEGDVLELTCSSTRQFEFVFFQNNVDIVSRPQLTKKIFSVSIFHTEIKCIISCMK